MSRAEALIIAKKNYAAYRAAVIANLFNKGPAVVDAEYGYRHGWIIVGEHSFNDEALTGQKYDMHQGGWAWL